MTASRSTAFMPWKMRSCSSVVDHTLDAAEAVDPRLDGAFRSLRIGDTVAVRSGDAACFLISATASSATGTLALGRDAQVVHHHPAPFTGSQQSDFFPDAKPRSGHNLAREAAPFSRTLLPTRRFSSRQTAMPS
jgi:hypothetical protein